MISFFQALKINPLLSTALWAAIAAAISSGVIGTYVVIKRIVFISGSIAHSVLGGMGFCLWLQRVWGVTWATPLLGALVAAILSAILIGWIHLYYRQREDAVIATLWSVGMAVGVIFIAQTPGFNVELTSFLLGNLLWASHADVTLLFCLDGFLLLAVIALRKQLLLLCFDEQQATLQGVPVRFLYLLLLTLIAISVVLLIQVVGIILALTILTLPSTIAGLYARRISTMIPLAIAIGLLFNIGGIALSYQLDWPPGATITLVAAFCYLCCLLAARKQVK